MTNNTSHQSTRSIIVGLLWHSMASGNLGVVALTFSQIAIVKEAAERAGKTVKIKVFGWQLDGSIPMPDGFEEIEYIGVNAKALLSPGSYLRKSLTSCQVVLDVGEGDSFSDIYGLKRLVYLCLSKRLAGAGGRRMILSPQTIGPFSTTSSAILARWALASATQVFARDPLSKQYLDENGQVTKSQEAIDMAFRLPFVKRAKQGGRIQIGLNVSGLLFAGGYSGKNELGLTLDFVELTHRTIEWALALPDADVWLIPHVMSRDIPEEDDVHASKKLISQYPRLQLAGPFNNPCDAKTFMSGLDFFVGGRMHACIGAFSAGVPTVPLAYSRKFNGLFASLKYPVLVDCKKMSVGEAFSTMTKAYDEREKLALDVGAGIRLAHEKLACYVDYVAQTLLEQRCHD
ncbi:hypothetical protein AT959_14555 [Dechloromonas denitrificans]|uniref:Polysaccharide pyruvyl transferase domain-containing protein n=1 Tax=Dechloromonas denitrificans TaxID=281362 RepID=A0A133XHX3_9RHOO|nr:polysaccharide pyruvyl transferase family protein [Dechloromonas denitrificans]KXB30544.1 hypothetical protein AT959_14555 [Dechloromonas denitrificans]